MHNVFANQARKASARAVHVAVDDDSVHESEFAVPSDQTRSLEMRDLDYALQRCPWSSAKSCCWSASRK
jgi:hypothetical protein